MAKKVIVFQINIGRGSLGQNNDVIPNSDQVYVNELAMPSVKAYCDHHGYEYVVYNGRGAVARMYRMYDNDHQNLVYERYFKLAGLVSIHGEDVTYVYVDNDVYVHNFNEPLPEIPDDGIYGVDESHQLFGQQIMHNVRAQHPDLDEGSALMNTGFFMCGGISARQLANYVKDKFSFRDKPNTDNCDFYKLDQGMIAEYFEKYRWERKTKRRRLHLLPHKWNYVIWPFGYDIHQPLPDELPNFIHPVGLGKMERYEHFINNSN